MPASKGKGAGRRDVCVRACVFVCVLIFPACLHLCVYLLLLYISTLGIVIS